MLVYTRDRTAYLPITINASSTFCNHFTKLGWNRSQLDLLDDSYEIFGHFRDPIERHFKGTAHFLIRHGITHLADDPVWQKVWKTAVMDLHSYPITWATVGHKIHWIPIHQNVDVVGTTAQWLSQRNIEIGEVQWMHKSDDLSIDLYTKLRNAEMIDKEHTLTYFYDADIVLWNKIVRGLQY
jgi:hypothetical protein